jgi:hypothetical protein
MLPGTGNGLAPGSPAATSGEGGLPPQADAVQNNANHAEASLPPAGVFDALSSALAGARTALSNFLELVALEARRAGLALMWMVAVGVIAAVCMVVAWLGLMAALVMCAVAWGFPAIAAVILLAVIHLLAGAVLIYLCIGLSRDLLFSATRRQVAGQSLVTPAAT